jgi:hypothetical protein
LDPGTRDGFDKALKIWLENTQTESSSLKGTGEEAVGDDSDSTLWYASNKLPALSFPADPLIQHCYGMVKYLHIIIKVPILII